MRSLVLSTLLVAVVVGRAFGATGDVLASFPRPAGLTLGRGMAFDGTFLYYTVFGLPPDYNIYKVTTSGTLVAIIPVAGSASHAGPLAWDGSALWTIDYDTPSFTLLRLNPVTGAILSSCDIAATNPAHPAVTSTPNIGHAPDGLAWTGTGLVISSDIVPSPNWVVFVDTSCVITSAFTTPVSPHTATSGVAFDGLDLWQATITGSGSTSELYQSDTAGVPTGLAFSSSVNVEDLAYDPTTFAPTCALWGNSAGGGTISAWEIPCGPGGPVFPTATHLECFAVVDPTLRRLRAEVDLTSLQFGLASNCTMSRAQKFCVPVKKTVTNATNAGVPVTLLPIDGPPLTTDFLCYKLKCGGTVGDREVADQFGSRLVGIRRTRELCVPAVKVTTTTTSSTTTTTSSTTTTTTFCPPPDILALTPTAGPVGTVVAVTGNNFTGATSVEFNGVGASFFVGSAMTLTATVPPGATTGPITVTTPCGSMASAVSFAVL